MPTPAKDETQDKFISRCIAVVTKEGKFEDKKQIAAYCYSLWRNAKGEKDEPPKEESSGMQRAKAA